jgi:hypothetical protein
MFNFIKVICLVICAGIAERSRGFLTVGDVNVYKPRWWFQTSPIIFGLAIIVSVAGIAGLAVVLKRALKNEEIFGKSIDFKSLSVFPHSSQS